MASVLKETYFHDEPAAFEALEKIMWPDGPVCSHCGVIGKAGKLEGVRSKPSKKSPQGEVRYGLWKCYACRGQFTVRKGTVFEASHLKLHQWFQAAFLMCSSKKGVSSNQLHRTLGCTLKTAWFVSMRLREAMAEGKLNPFGFGGGAVEADETYIGQKRGWKKQTGGYHKMKVLTLINRDTKQAKSTVMTTINSETVKQVVLQNVAREARLMTDEASYYNRVGKLLGDHQAVNHGADEYVRYTEDEKIHTNTAEGYFSVFKRGMKGVYQHCRERHLHRYMAEFDFRYNNRIALGVNDQSRTTRALIGAKGKRLMYRNS